MTTTVPGDATSATITGLDNSTDYYFTVLATNGVAEGPGRSSGVIPSLLSVADSYMLGPLDTLLDAREAAPAPFNWTDDSCGGTYVPDLFMADPCLRHDFGYRNYGKGLALGPDEDTRHWIDDLFLEDMLDQCTKSEFILLYPDCVAQAYSTIKWCGSSAGANTVSDFPRTGFPMPRRSDQSLVGCRVLVALTLTGLIAAGSWFFFDDMEVSHGAGFGAVVLVAAIPAWIYALGVRDSRKVVVLGTVLLTVTAVGWLLTVLSHDPLGMVNALIAFIVSLFVAAWGAVHDRFE